jgi:hypothetical protein
MLYYFPTLFPDEKLSHGWARYAERIGDKKIAFQDLFGGSHHNDHFRFQKFETNIGAFVLNLPQTIPYTVDYLLDKHTLYPLHSFTLSKRAALELRSAMKEHHIGKRGRFIVSPENQERRVARYCAECAKEDINSYGETFWHRIHQIPDINVCAEHQCWLENTNLQLDSSRPRNR